MTTQLIKIRGLMENHDDFSHAGELLRNGDIVAIPTETVYGLAANAYDKDAVAKIFLAKGRPQDNPLIVHIADFDTLSDIVSEIPDTARELAANFWPGPLTMIMKKGEKIPAEVTAGLDSVAVRLPSHKYARVIIEAAGVPLAAPSANLSGKPSPTTAQHVLQDMDGRIPLILDGGKCEVGLESTVIDLTGNVPVLLRPGGITLHQLREVLGEVSVNPKILEAVDDNESVPSPGMKYKHYAPSAPVVIIDGASQAFAEYVFSNSTDKKVAVLCFEEERKLFDNSDITVVSYGSSTEPNELAHRLFSALRVLDESQLDIIYAREPKTSDGIELAIVNRLSRAAAFSRIIL